jgi:mRNA interferase HigB
MRIIKPQTLQGYSQRYPTARASLAEWLARTRAGQWENMVDLRRTFPSADSAIVGSGSPVIIFNIAGNQFRLITAVHFNRRVVYVLMFMTHADYSKDRWKDAL